MTGAQAGGCAHVHTRVPDKTPPREQRQRWRRHVSAGGRSLCRWGMVRQALQALWGMHGPRPGLAGAQGRASREIEGMDGRVGLQLVRARLEHARLHVRLVTPQAHTQTHRHTGTLSHRHTGKIGALRRHSAQGGTPARRSAGKARLVTRRGTKTRTWGETSARKRPLRTARGKPEKEQSVNIHLRRRSARIGERRRSSEGHATVLSRARPEATDRVWSAGPTAERGAWRCLRVQPRAGTRGGGRLPGFAAVDAQGSGAHRTRARSCRTCTCAHSRCMRTNEHRILHPVQTSERQQRVTAAQAMQEGGVGGGERGGVSAHEPCRWARPQHTRMSPLMSNDRSGPLKISMLHIHSMLPPPTERMRTG